MANQLIGASLFVLFCWSRSILAAQALDPPISRQVERTVAVESGKTARVGAYANVKKDCTSGPLPVIRLTGPPQEGRFVVKRARIRISKADTCLSAEVPGLVALYRSRPGFSGADKITIEIKIPDGETRSQTITINVKPVSLSI